MWVVDRQISELRDQYPWKRFNKGKIVDVGGGSGHVSINMAKVFGQRAHNCSFLLCNQPLTFVPAIPRS